jgi:hypothetical protein
MLLISRTVGTTANDFLLAVCRGDLFILQRTINEVIYFFLPFVLELGGKVRVVDKLAFVWCRFIFLPPVSKFLRLRGLFLCLT